MARAYAQAPIPSDEAAREIAVIASGLLEPERVMALHAIAWRAARFFETKMASATIIFKDLQRVVASTGFDAVTTSRATSFCAYTILEPRKVMCVPDAGEDERFAGNAHVVGAPYIRFYAGAPLLSASGHPIGALCIMNDRPRACLDTADEHMLCLLAGQIMAISRKGGRRH